MASFRFALAAVLFFAALVACQHLYLDETKTIEGTWTDSRYGGRLYFCINDDRKVFGTYSEVGVYWGEVNPYHDYAKGRWYQAGNSACNSGWWEAEFLDDDDRNTLNFQAFCDFGGQRIYRYNESRITHVANDKQCNVVYEKQSVVGSWGNLKLGYKYIDMCDSEDDDEGHGSFERTLMERPNIQPVNGDHVDDESLSSDSSSDRYSYEVIPIPDDDDEVLAGLDNTVDSTATEGPVGYMTGQIMENGQLFQGDFVTQNVAGRYRSGSVLFFAVSADEAVLFTWPGERIEPFADHTVDQGIRFRDSYPNQCEANRRITQPRLVIEDNGASSLQNWATLALLLICSLVALL